jgi:hypothetical protein
MQPKEAVPKRIPCPRAARKRFAEIKQGTGEIQGNFFLTEPENPLELDKIFHFPIGGGKPWGEWLPCSCL